MINFRNIIKSLHPDEPILIQKEKLLKPDLNNIHNIYKLIILLLTLVGNKKSLDEFKNL